MVLSRCSWRPIFCGRQEHSLSGSSLHGTLTSVISHHAPQCPAESTALPQRMRVSPGLKMSPPPCAAPKSGMGLFGNLFALNTIDADMSFAPGPLVVGAHGAFPSSHPSIEWIRMPAAAKDPSSFHG